MAPIDSWRNSTPDFGAVAFCTTNIEDFRTSLTSTSSTISSTYSSQKRSLRWISSKRKIMEVIEIPPNRRDFDQPLILYQSTSNTESAGLPNINVWHFCIYMKYQWNLPLCRRIRAKSQNCLNELLLILICYYYYIVVIVLAVLINSITITLLALFKYTFK